MMISVAELVWTSFSAVLPVFFIIGVGTLAVNRKIINPYVVNRISHLLTYILMPCLIFMQVGRGISIELLRDSWVLLVGSFLHVVVNFVVSKYFLVKLVGRDWDSESRFWWVCGLSFSNTVALPLIFITTVCDSQILFSHPKGYDDRYYHNPNTGINETYPTLTNGECRQAGQIYVFAYMLIPLFCLFFVTATQKEIKDEDFNESMSVESTSNTSQNPMCKSVELQRTHQQGQLYEPETDDGAVEIAIKDAELDLEKDEYDEAKDQGCQFRKRMPQQPNTSLILEEEFQRMEEQREVQQHETIVNDFGVVAEPPEIVQENLDPIEPKQGCKFWFSFYMKLLGLTITQPVIFAQLVAVMVGLIPPVKNFVFTFKYMAPVTQTMSILAEAVIPLTNLMLAASLGIKLQSVDKKEILLMNNSSERKQYVVFMIAKMLIFPAFWFALFYLVRPWLPENELLVLVLLFETAMPCANMVIILAAKSCPGASGRLSLSMIHQYSIGLVTLPSFLALALYMSKSPQ